MGRGFALLLAAALAVPASVAPVSTHAQDGFCAVLKQVQGAARHAFASLGKVKQTDGFAKSEPLGVVLPGFPDCRLHNLMGLISYHCEIEVPSMSEAHAVKSRLGEELLLCYPGAKVDSYGNPLESANRIRYMLFGDRSKNLPTVNPTVGVNSRKGKYTTYIIVPTPK